MIKEDKQLLLSNIIKTIEDCLKNADLLPYKDLGNGLYELPGNIITNRKGCDEYLEELKKTLINSKVLNEPKQMKGGEVYGKISGKTT